MGTGYVLYMQNIWLMILSKNCLYQNVLKDTKWFMIILAQRLLTVTKLSDSMTKYISDFHHATAQAFPDATISRRQHTIAYNSNTKGQYQF